MECSAARILPGSPSSDFTREGENDVGSKEREETGEFKHRPGHPSPYALKPDRDDCQPPLFHWGSEVWPGS